MTSQRKSVKVTDFVVKMAYVDFMGVIKTLRKNKIQTCDLGMEKDFFVVGITKFKDQGNAPRGASRERKEKKVDREIFKEYGPNQAV